MKPKKKSNDIQAPLIWPKFTNFLENIFGEKLPKFSKDTKESLTKIIPFFLFFLGIYAFLRVLSIGVSSVGGAYSTQELLLITPVALLFMFEAVFSLFSFKNLRAKKLKGWEWFYYASVASLFTNLMLAITFTAIFVSLVGSFLRMYIVFQIRSEYK